LVLLDIYMDMSMQMIECHATIKLTQCLVTFWFEWV
jgi:hypothetical protein